MSEAYDQIINIINKVRKRLSLLIFLKGFLLWVSFIAGLLVVECALDILLTFPSKIKLIILLADILALIILLVIFILKPYLNRPNIDEIAVTIQKRYLYLKDDLINAVQLFRNLDNERNYVSEELIEKLVKNTAEKIKIVKTKEIIKIQEIKNPLSYFSISFIFLILFLFIAPQKSYYSLSGFIYPFRYAKAEDFFIVSPGNKEIIAGGNIDIKVQTKKNIVPSLRYAYSKGDWKQILMNQAEANVFLYTFENIKEPIKYSVCYRNILSPVYKINIHQIPQVGNISISYKYPEYTGQPLYVDKDTSGDIRAILGTEVNIIAYSNVPLNKAFLVTDDGKNLPIAVINNGVNLVTNLILTGEKQYWFRVEDKDGYVNPDPVKYNIFNLNDEFPYIEVLFPAADVTVSETNELKVVFKTTDDFGVRQVDLVYKKEDEQSFSRTTIKKFNPAPKDKVSEYEWPLRKLNLSPGNLLSYYLEVFDNDVISGPKKSVSSTYYIEIFSYEKEHKTIEILQEFFYEELLKILEEQITMRSKLDDMQNQRAEEKIKELKKGQENISQRTGELNNLLDKMITQMSNDPLTKYQVYSEYDNINQNLKVLKNTKMNEANQIFNDLLKAKSSEEKAQYVDKEKTIEDDIIKELEKISVLTEDINQYQKMDDLLGNAYELEDMSTDFNKRLEEYKNNPDTEKLKQLQDALAKLYQMMNEFKKNLRDLAQDLPEEFINQKDIQNIDFSKMEELTKQLKESLDTGNLDQALQYALDLAKELSTMMSAMQLAASQVSMGGQSSYLSGEIDQLSREIEKLAKEEQKLIEETAEIDKKRLEAVLKEQEKLLRELAKKQEELIKKTKLLEAGITQEISITSQSIYNLHNLLRNNLRFILPKMEKIYEELSNLKVYNSSSLLEECIEILRQTGNNLELYSKETEKELTKIQQETQKEIQQDNIEKSKLNKNLQELMNKQHWLQNIFSNNEEIRIGEQEILEALKGKEESLEGIFSKQEEDKLKDISKRQSSNRLNTEKLEQKLEMLSRKTALIGLQIKDNLDKAGQSMQEAEGHLSDKKTGQALDKEQEALYNLSRLQESLQNAAKSLAEMEQKMGMPMASFMQPRGGSSGRSGVATGFVKIPSPEDYQVPQDFRQEIMEGLKEKFPKVYEKLIREYYKRIIE